MTIDRHDQEIIDTAMRVGLFCLYEEPGEKVYTFKFWPLVRDAHGTASANLMFTAQGRAQAMAFINGYRAGRSHGAEAIQEELKQFLSHGWCKACGGFGYHGNTGERCLACNWSGRS